MRRVVRKEQVYFHKRKAENCSKDFFYEKINVRKLIKKLIKKTKLIKIINILIKLIKKLTNFFESKFVSKIFISSS